MSGQESKQTQEYSLHDEAVSSAVSMAVAEADVLQNLKHLPVPLALPDAVFGFGAKVDAKTWKWVEWYIPPQGQG